MALLTTVTKPKAEYHQWAASELSDGDIIDVYNSLGSRGADSVTIESLGGATTLRFNVIQRVYKQQGSPDHNPWVGLGAGSPRTNSPYLVGEVENASMDDIVIEADSIQTWTRFEMRVTDIKIVTKSAGLKITVT